MNIFKQISKWLIIVFIIQTITFFTIGPIQLKRKLLPENFTKNKFYSDSVFVRDYYTSDCYAGEYYVVNYPLNLKNYSDELKEKLGVKFIHFSEEQIANWLEENPDNYNLLYTVNARSTDWTSLFGFY